MNFPTEQITITLPIARADRQTAWEFARDQPTPETSQRVYENTLAVLVTRTYLQMLDVPTQLEASSSWHRAGRLGADIADLYLPGVGHLECRPIREGDRACFVPQEVWSDRIGYIVVQLDPEGKAGTLLGFVPQVTTTSLALTQLQPLDLLLDALHDPAPSVQLSQWLEGILARGWQMVEELFGTQNIRPALVFSDLKGNDPERSRTMKEAIAQFYIAQTGDRVLPEADPVSVLVHLLQTTEDEETRWKAAELLWELEPEHPAGGARRVKDLGLYLASYAVALMVAIIPKRDRSMAVLVRVYPCDHPHLPPGLQLSGLDDAGHSFFTVQARKKDDYIQFKFTADPGDRFSLKVALEDANIVEHFII
jgi:Protein of unknown function (DUF1822)